LRTGRAGRTRNALFLLFLCLGFLARFGAALVPGAGLVRRTETETGHGSGHEGAKTGAHDATARGIPFDSADEAVEPVAVHGVLRSAAGHAAQIDHAPGHRRRATWH
jgi:hypothetical protein